MPDEARVPKTETRAPAEFYCPQCDRPVDDPLRCGDCGSLLCRSCGSPVEQADDLGIG